jgi:hypothetical protein
MIERGQTRNENATRPVQAAGSRTSELPHVESGTIRVQEMLAGEGRIEEQRPYRMRGKLELSHSEIEPLPPTPITDDARERLHEWGVSDASIERLREFTSSFRYDLCEQKAERIVQNGGYLLTTPEGGEKIVLPDFFDTEGRLDGQCSDLTRQWVKLLHTSEYLQELDERMDSSGQQRIHPCSGWGLSRTHFNRQGGDQHLYAGLLKEGRPQTDMIAVDPSFQEISCIESNGYSLPNPYISRVRSGAFFEANTATCCSVKSAVMLDHEMRVSIGSGPILGTSSDGKLVYYFSFVRDTFKKYHPVVCSIPPRESYGTGRTHCFLDRRGNARFVEDRFLTDIQRDEMAQICRTLEGIQLIRDQERAQALKDEEVLIRW